MRKTRISLGKNKEALQALPSVASSEKTPHITKVLSETPPQKTIEQLWHLVQQANIYQARLMSENLIQHLESKIENEGEALARSYNHQRLLRRIINIEQKFSHLGVDCNFIAREIGLIREKSIPGYRDGRI